MLTKSVSIQEYYCESCSKKYRNKKSCEEHEKNCTTTYLGSIFSQNLENLSPETDYHWTVCSTNTRHHQVFEFYRMMVYKASGGYTRGHIWLYGSRAITDGKFGEMEFSTNNNWHKEKCPDRWADHNNLVHKEYFKFDDTDDYKAHENVVYVKTRSTLQEHILIITYKNGKVVTLSPTTIGHKDEKHAIKLYKSNPIKSIQILNIDRSNPEIFDFKSAMNTCSTPCPNIEGMWIGSHSCRNNCPNFVNKGDPYGKVNCNYKTNNGIEH